MKFYLIHSKKRNWTNKAAREALNVTTYSNVRITNGNNVATLTLSRAPASAARVMRAVQTMTGIFGIAVDRASMSQLQARPGDVVEVTNESVVTVERTSTNKNGAKPQVELVGGKRVTLKEKMKDLEVGDELEVSESAANSTAYAVAKDISMKIMRVSGTNRIKRVS